MYPTPTPFPTLESMPIDMSAVNDFDAWAMASHSIQVWNMAGDVTIVVQLVILVFIIVAIAGLFVVLVGQVTKED